MLHILNGESPAGTLRRSSLHGTYLTYSDVLHEGPVPAGLDDERLREVRARFIADHGWGSFEDILRQFREWDATLDRFSQYDEVVLWFEHDLFDQLLLIRHLDWFARRVLGSTKLTLICIGEFPGVEPFHGLGQLSAGQLISLFPRRTPVTGTQFELGRRAWAAFRSADPRSIERLLADDTSALPFLAGALTRHLQEFPATANGLSRTEREVLRLLESGPMDPASLFREEQGREERVFMGDAWFWWRVETLARAKRPLVTLNVQPRDPSLPTGTVTITDTGRAVLSGRADWLAIASINRWLGGVHLQSDRTIWRWNEGRARMETEMANG
jgi:hypothetical protein